MTVVKNKYTLANLNEVPLDARNRTILAAAEGRASGDPIWRHRKLAEFRSLLALSQIAWYRIKLLFWDLESEALRVISALQAPVPLAPIDDGRLRRAPDDTAIVGLTYPREVLYKPLPGSAFSEILTPAGVFIPTISSGERQAVCLGPAMPIGIPVTEILVLTYITLCMQIATVDSRYPAGVFNPEAANYYSLNPQLFPLSHEPFLRKNTPSATDDGDPIHFTPEGDGA
jgi:hypothetical protein